MFVIFDETPFFIKDNFDSLAALAKNVRSMNSSVLFTSQVSSDLVGPEGEETLFSQSSYKILFTTDSEKNIFKRRTKISDENFSFLDALEKPPGRGKRRFVLCDDFGEKIIGVKLTDEEYFRATTDPKDKEDIEKTRKLLNLTEFQARKILEYRDELISS